MKKVKKIMFLLCVSCMLLGMMDSVKAADERLGTVVDGSLLTEKSDVIGFTPEGIARGTYLASGSGRLTIKGTRYVTMSGDTTCNRTSDEVKVTLHLQRLVGKTWTTVYTLGPKVAKNTTYVSNSNNYTIAGGYYYRVSGSHTAIKGTTTETTASYTDGIWIN